MIIPLKLVFITANKGKQLIYAKAIDTVYRLKAPLCSDQKEKLRDYATNLLAKANGIHSS